VNLAAISATPGVVTPFGRLSVEKRGKMFFTCCTDFFGRKRIVAPLNHNRTLFASMDGQHPYSQQALFRELERREEQAEAMAQRELDDQGRDFQLAITAIAQSAPDGRHDVLKRMGFHL